MKVTAVYFSPTGNSKRYAVELSGRLTKDWAEWNLTNRDTREQTHTFGTDELAILAAPVYGGRLPTIPGQIFDRIVGNGGPAVVLVTYGNRAYEDALLELSNIARERGFVPIAAGAFIGPHTFSTKIAAGRPDAADLAAVDRLAEGVKRTLAAGVAGKNLHVPGHTPYKPEFSMPFKPAGNEDCTHCGLCVRECPVGAIPADDPKRTDVTLCIDCFRCVRVCPVQARNIYSPSFTGLMRKLESGLTQVTMAPELFFAE